MRVSNKPHAELPHFSNRPGFTLLELVLSLMMIALLVGMVFSTARSSLMLGSSVVQTQNEEILHQTFFDFLESRLSALPGNTRLDLAVTDSPSHYLSDLTLEKVPMTFKWGGDERTAKAVQLSTVLRQSGYLDIVLKYYENEIIDPDSSEGPGPTSTSSVFDNEPFAEIVLLADVRYFEWRILDGRTLEYDYVWNIPGRLPLQLELTCAFGAEGEPIRQIFWIPPRQNPEIFMRQMQDSMGGAGGGGGDTEEPASEERPPPSTSPSGNRPPTPRPQPGNR